jgi:hypothetical protein
MKRDKAFLVSIQEDFIYFHSGWGKRKEICVGSYPPGLPDRFDSTPDARSVHRDAEPQAIVHFQRRKGDLRPI